MTEENLDQPLYLKFSSPCHPFPFVDSDMEVSVQLCDDTGKVIYGKDILFRIVLQYEDDTESILEDALLIRNADRQMIHSNTGRSPIIKLRCSVPTNNRPYVLTALPLNNSSLINHIFPSTSSSFQVVTHRLGLMNENTIPNVWFRDEGGKSNGITVKVNLTDSRNQLVTSRGGMRLRCALLYDDGSFVPDQNLLEISSDSTLFLNSDGNANIKFRMLGVSQKHDSRKFKVMIAPDTQYNQINGDVSHLCTPCIEVRSKVSRENKLKRQRREEEARQNQAAKEEEIRRKKPAVSDIGNISPSNSSLQLLDEGVSSGQYQTMKRFSESAVESLLDLRHSISNSSITLDEVASSIDRILDFHQRLGLTPPIGTHSSSNLTFEDIAPARQVSDWKRLPSLDWMREISDRTWVNIGMPPDMTRGYSWEPFVPDANNSSK